MRMLADEDTCHGVRSFRARASTMSALLERTRLRVGAARPRTISPCRGPARAGAPARFQRPRGRVARAAREDDREEPSRDELIAKLNKSLEGLDEPMDGEVRHTNHTAAPRSSAPESTSLTCSLASPLPPPTPPSLTSRSKELKSLVMERWGRAYDTRICRRRDGLGAMRLYLQGRLARILQRAPKSTSSLELRTTAEGLRGSMWATDPSSLSVCLFF